MSKSINTNINTNTDTNHLDGISKLYKKVTYFDQYGGSLFLFFIITIFLCISISYCYVKIHAQYIINDWPNQRCNPKIIPFAGFITRPEGTTATEYTYQNFNYCTQQILSSITGHALEPITHITSSLSNMVNSVSGDINNARAMFNNIRNFLQIIIQEIMGRLMNITVPLQQIIISTKDLIGKIQGTMSASLFTLLGSYYTLKSLMGAIAQFIVTILIAFAIIIAMFWIFPFTWGIAITSTALFVSISIPFAIILVFLMDVLKVQTNLSIPAVPSPPSTKCFDENTQLKMNDGTFKEIKNIKIGDILENNNNVTAVIKVDTKGSSMYNLNGVIISDTHIVKYNHNKKWVKVSEHPDAIQLNYIYDKKYLYCLNTTNKEIHINNTVFTDWDEVCETELLRIKERLSLLNEESVNENIHKHLDGGFDGLTKIKLKDNSIQYIKNIKIGDILENGEIVYGIVEINGATLCDQFKYIFNDNTHIEGGPNIVFTDAYSIISTLSVNNNYIKKQLKATSNKQQKLYHLLTDAGKFKISNLQFYDYNSCINIFLDKL